MIAGAYFLRFMEKGEQTQKWKYIILDYINGWKDITKLKTCFSYCCVTLFACFSFFFQFFFCLVFVLCIIFVAVMQFFFFILLVFSNYKVLSFSFSSVVLVFYLADLHADDLPIAITVTVHHVQQESVLLLCEHFALNKKNKTKTKTKTNTWIKTKNQNETETKSTKPLKDKNGNQRENDTDKKTLKNKKQKQTWKPRRERQQKRILYHVNTSKMQKCTT